MLLPLLAGDIMKKFVIALVALFVISCGTPPPSLVTAQGQQAYKANQLVNELGILQDAAIGANSQKLLSDAHTRLIVVFVKSSVTTIAATPSGWKTTVQTGLAQLKADLGTDEAKYDIFFNLIATIIVGVS